MLRQILQDMYVDPEILAELPEEQREMLFFKIRQEQVRRYNEREKTCATSSPTTRHRRTRKIRILEDKLGEPWTWVFGEEPGETTVEEKWKRLSDKRIEQAIREAILEEQNQKTRKISSGKRVTGHCGEADDRTRKAGLQREQKMRLPKTVSAKTLVIVTEPADKNVRKISMPAKLYSALDENTKQNLKVNKPKTVRFSPNSSPITSPEASPVLPKRIGLKKQSPMSSPIHSPNIGNRVKETAKCSPKSVRRIYEEVGMISKHSQHRSLDSDKEVQSHEQKRRERLSYYDNIELKSSLDDDVMSNEEWKTQPRKRARSKRVSSKVNDKSRYLVQRFKEADERRSAAARRASLEFKRQQLLLEKQPKNFRNKIASKLSKIGGITIAEKREHDSRPLLPQRPENFSRKPFTRSRLPSRPQTTHDVKAWFEETQLQVLTDEEFIGIPGWFHGIISRPDAEELLRSKSQGSFLIRVSDKIWGYTLTYKDSERIKHFLIDASVEGTYFFFGNDNIRHDSLKELLEYHKLENISLHGEKLRNWVGQSNPKNPDYTDILPKPNNKIDELRKEFKAKLK